MTRPLVNSRSVTLLKTIVKCVTMETTNGLEGASEGETAIAKNPLPCCKTFFYRTIKFMTSSGAE